jgi:hypothetical protein
MNTLSTPRVIFVLLLLLPILTASQCGDPPNSYVERSPRIYVGLKGAFAEGESATATIDGKSIGIVNTSTTRYLDVTPGSHHVVVTTTKIPTTFNYTADVMQGQYLTYKADCGLASVTMIPDKLYARETKELLVNIDGYLGLKHIPPDRPYTEKIGPGIPRKFDFYDDAKKLRYSASTTFLPYNSTFSMDIPYK